MTDHRIAYSKPTGEICVVVPSPRYVSKLMAQGMTEDEAIDAIQAKDVPADAADVARCTTADLPARDEFRNAWRRDTTPGPKPVKVDLPAAREIQRQRVEAAAEARLTALAAAKARADLIGDTTTAQAAQAEAQTLTAELAAIDYSSAKTIAQLRTRRPASLPPE